MHWNISHHIIDSFIFFTAIVQYSIDLFVFNINKKNFQEKKISTKNVTIMCPVAGRVGGG